MIFAKRPITLAGICALGLLVLLLATQPSSLPAPVLVAPFLLLFSALALLCYGVISMRGISRGRSAGLALLLAGVPIVLLALQSVGQLSWRDTITIVVLFGVAYIYMSRMARAEHR